jgi:hypothetical protein
MQSAPSTGWWTGSSGCPLVAEDGMERLHEPKSDALRALYWRDEILQLMFWIRGEGFGDAIDPALLERFLGVQAEVGIRYLDHLVGEGLLEAAGHGPTGSPSRATGTARACSPTSSPT